MQLIRLTCLQIGSVAFVSSIAAPLAQGQVDPSTLLAKAKESITWTDHSRQTVHVDYPSGNVADILLSRDGQKFEVKGKTTLFKNGQKQPTTGAFINIVNNDIQFYLVSDRVQIAREPENRDLWLHLNLSSLQYGGFLDGAFLDPNDPNEKRTINALDLAPKGTLRLLPQTQCAGVPCEVVESSFPTQTLTLCIAPSRNYTLLHYDMKFGVMPLDKETFEVNFDNSSLMDVDGRAIIAGGRITLDDHYPDGHTDTSVFLAQRKSVDLHPIFDKDTFSSNVIPNGTPISFYNNHGDPNSLRLARRKTDATHRREVDQQHQS